MTTPPNISLEEIQKIIELLKHPDKANRALGLELMHSQNALESLSRFMVGDEANFYPTHSQTHYLYFFEGFISQESVKGMLLEVEEKMVEPKLAVKFPALATMSFRRRLYNILVELMHRRQRLSEPDEDKFFHHIRLLIVIQPAQCLLFVGKTSYTETLVCSLPGEIYLNEHAHDLQKLNNIYKDIIKKGPYHFTSRYPPLSLGSVDIIRKSRSPIQYLFFPQEQRERVSYVMKVALNFEKVMSKRNK